MPAYPSTSSFPLTFPATPKFTRFSIREIWKTPVTESPFTGDQQVFKYTGSNKLVWEADIPPMKLGDSAIDTWVQFLLELQGRYGTFTLNLQTHSSTIEYVKGYTGLPTTWRSRDEGHGFEWNRQRFLSGVTIRAIEA